jgi:prepilin-type N-terminal cleavage/methylation domain-containing protein
MMERIWRQRREEDHGFSLVELLIVIIIMGILAVIAIPMFLSQREKAEDAAAKADVETLGKELTTWFVDHTSSQIPNIEINDTDGRAYLLGLGTPPLDPATDKVGNASRNVTAIDGSDTVTLTLADGTAGTVTGKNWCVGLKNAEGKVQEFYYSSYYGLNEGSCDGS